MQPNRPLHPAEKVSLSVYNYFRLGFAWDELSGALRILTDNQLTSSDVAASIVLPVRG